MNGPSGFGGRISLLLKVLVSGLLLFLLAHAIPLEGAIAALRKVSLFSWFANTLLVGAATALGAWRWHLASRKEIPLRTCLSYYWMGLFYTFVLPGSVAGDMARTAALAALAPEHRTIALPVSVLLDRLGGLATTLVILVLASGALLFARTISIGGALALTVAVSLLGILAVASPWILARCATWLQHHSRSPRLLHRVASGVAGSLAQVPLGLWSRILLLSVAIHALSCLGYALAARATGVEADIWRLAVYYAVFSLAVMLPITIAGVGLREQMAVWLLGRADTAGIASVALSWLILAVTLVHVLIGAALHLIHTLGRRRPPPVNPPASGRRE